MFAKAREQKDAVKKGLAYFLLSSTKSLQELVATSSKM